MKKAVRNAITFLERTQGMERHIALAYLSAAADFEVSQVVDAGEGRALRDPQAGLPDVVMRLVAESAWR